MLVMFMMLLTQTAGHKVAVPLVVLLWLSNMSISNKEGELLSGKLLCVYLKKKKKNPFILIEPVVLFQFCSPLKEGTFDSPAVDLRRGPCDLNPQYSLSTRGGS